MAIELAEINPSHWTAADDDAAEEMAFAAECLAALRELYSQAAARNQVVICEDI